VLVYVAVEGGLGVLVGVGVAVGDGAIIDNSGQLQLAVAVIATTRIPRIARL
jgi:hypothetical protein